MSRHPAGPTTTAARLTWGALAGRVLDDEDRARLGLGLGGVVLFERNVGTPAELRALTASIRAAAAGPVRISMDQEGGHVVRVAEPMTRFPGPMAIAATRSTRLARMVAAATARELRSLGVDTVLAPSLDVAAIPDNPAVGTRAYADRASVVARFGAAAVRGFLEGGAIPVAKHLPGHGRTAEDSHVAWPQIGGSRAVLDAVDLPPFEAAIAAGAPALMTAHVVYDALDPRRPASLSPALVRLARGRLGFRGALVTDALVMDAIADRYPLEEAGVRAIEAGMDVAMAIEGQRRVLAGLAAAIDAGTLSTARTRDALRRVVALDRMAAALPGRPLGVTLPDAVIERHRRLAREVAAASLTLVADGGLLPIAARTSVLVVDVLSASRSPIEGPTAADRAGERLARALPRADAITVAADDPLTAETLDAIERATQATGLVVLLTRDAFATRAGLLVRRLASGAAPLVHVGLRNPLDLTLAAPGHDRTATLVAAYADTPATIDALAARLTGRAPFRGRLPVSLAPAAVTAPVPAPAAAPARIGALA